MSTISAGTTSTTTLIHSGDTTGSLVLKTNDTGSGGTTAMTIDTSQNVGIGTSSPTKKLSVNGDIRLGDGGGTGAIFTDATNGLRFMQPASGTSSTESMRIDSSGNVLAGYSSAFDLSPSGTGQYAGISVSTSSSANWKLGALSFSADNVGNGLLFVKSRSATVGTNTVVQSGDALGNIVWRGADGTNYINAAAIQAWVDGTPGTNDMPGRITFSTTADGTSSITERMRIDSSGNVLVTNVAGLGYGTGSGGTVTQATSKSTAVTLNKPTGQITMSNASLGASTEVTFTLNNSLISTTDIVTINPTWPTAASRYQAYVTSSNSGSCQIVVKNRDSGTAYSEAVVLNFAIIKGATS